jgi:hypothetical protein
MKNKLQSLIRRAINEVLNEDENALVATKSGTKVIPFKNTTELSSLAADSNVSSITTTSGKKLKEMARPVIMYKLTDGYEDKLSELDYFGSEKRMKWVNGIIEYIDQEGPSDITTIATEKFNVPQPRIADYARDMIRLGILVPEQEGVVPQFMRPEDEEGEGEIEGPDGMFMGNASNPLAQYFDDKPNADGSEDFPSETEPELPATQEPFKAVGPVAKAAEFTTDNDRLIDKIIKIYGASKLRVKEVAGDSELSGADFAKAEKGRKETATEQLPNLIQQLADRISTEDEETQAAILGILAKKFASVNYSSLSKKVAAALGTIAPQVQEPEMTDLELGDEEDEIESLDEYTKRKLQFYAGIIK